MGSTGVLKACQIIGSQTKLAKALNISHPTVHEWIKEKKPVPPIRCVEIEDLTDKAVTRQELRPNDWWKIWPELNSSS